MAHTNWMTGLVASPRSKSAERLMVVMSLCIMPHLRSFTVRSRIVDIGVLARMFEALRFGPLTMNLAQKSHQKLAEECEVVVSFDMATL